jgi:acyl carrier protein
LQFGQEPLCKEDDKVIKIGPPGDDEEKSSDVWSPASFLLALMDPYLPRYHENVQRDFFLYKNFLWSMDINPHFYRFITKETKNIKWMKNHRRELAYLLLLDILSEDIPTIKKANLEFQEDYREEDRTRQRRLLRNEYYPELFLNPTDYIEKRMDERNKNNSTIATENLDFGRDYMSSFQLMMALNQKFVANLPPQKELDYWDGLNACIKLVSADEIQDIITFGDELNEALDRVLLRVSNLDGDRKIIVDEIRKKTDLIEQFRINLNTAV